MSPPRHLYPLGLIRSPLLQPPEREGEQPESSLTGMASPAPLASCRTRRMICCLGTGQCRIIAREYVMCVETKSYHGHFALHVAIYCAENADAQRPLLHLLMLRKHTMLWRHATPWIVLT